MNSEFRMQIADCRSRTLKTLRARAFVLASLAFIALARALPAQHLLVPMDDRQTNHLKAYGLIFNALRDGHKSEWFLNYRGGSFLLPDIQEMRRRAALDGILAEPINNAQLQAIRAEIASNNMDAVALERAPKIAIYTPPKAPPWDDAVTLALQYAGIEYATVWDDEVIAGDLTKYDWLHLHHEDFTGQLNKLYLGFRDAPWFVEQRDRGLAAAKRMGYPTLPALKKAVAEKMRQYVEHGGFLFAMCGATETLGLAIAARERRHRRKFRRRNADRRQRRPEAGLEPRVCVPERARRAERVRELDERHRRPPGERHRPPAAVRPVPLFGFSAKFDPVASMLVQDHRQVIPGFLWRDDQVHEADAQAGRGRSWPARKARPG